MFKTVRNHTKSQRLNLRLGLFSSLPIRKNSWQIHYLSDPTPVFLLFDINFKRHKLQSYSDAIRFGRATVHHSRLAQSPDFAPLMSHLPLHLPQPGHLLTPPWICVPLTMKTLLQ
jgi:hypothetical protein